MAKLVCSFIFLLLCTNRVNGHCPDSKYLWNRIIYLRDSKVAPLEQLNELTDWLKKTKKCNSRIDSTQALLLHRIGWLYSQQKDFSSAIQFTLQSITLVKAQISNTAIKQTQLITSYYNLQILYDSLKLEPAKNAAIDSCIAYAIRFKGEYLYGLAALNIKVKQLFENGDYYNCIRYAKTAGDILKANSKTLQVPEGLETEYSTWKINSYIFLNDTKNAEDLLKNELKKFGKKSKNSQIPGELLILYGLIYKEKGNAQKAINYFERAYHQNKKNNYPQGSAEALNNIGYTYLTLLKQYKKALPYHFKALKYADANESLNILDNIANIYVQRGIYDSAFYFFQKAFDQLRPGFKEKDLLENNEETDASTSEYITGLLIDKASALLKEYKLIKKTTLLKEVLITCQLTDRYFDKLRTSQADIQSKLFWKTNNRRLYELAVEACYESKDFEMAFYFFEKSRSVLLNEQISIQQKMTYFDLAKQAQLQRNIFEIENRLKNTSTSAAERIDLQQKLFANNQELEILIKNINNKYPANFQNYSDTSSFTINTVRKKILIQASSLLEIFNGDSSVFILSITQNYTSLIKIDKRMYDQLSNSYISFVTNPILLNRNFIDFSHVSHQLYELIFKNINLPANGSLIISPDGKGFPFEALLVNNNSSTDYLLNHFATSYTYSAKYLMNEYTFNSSKSNNVLGIAPVKYNADLELPELYGSDISLQEIKKSFPRTTDFVFKNASKKNFLNAFQDYTIVQFYTHASEDSISHNPVIYFADSALYLSELITDRKPITQLVVLSACETANGKLYQGEGIFSFNRAFAALGIPAAVSNLWSVNNESTYSITELFYKYLSQGLSSDIALQKAKLEFIDKSTSLEKKLPYFWAGSILTGKVGTIKKYNDWSWKVLVISAVFVLSGFGYFIKRKVLKRVKDPD